MTALDILHDWLKTNGYDGLVDDNGECGCELGNLVMCESDPTSCIAGHKVECDCGEDCSFHIAPGPRPITKRESGSTTEATWNQ
jgi:hypothetical protein